MLLDNTWRSSFDFGKTEPGVYSFGAVDGPLNYYLIYGPSPRQVLESYAWLTGKPPLPPMWTLGFQQSRYTYVPQSRVLKLPIAYGPTGFLPTRCIWTLTFRTKIIPFTVDCIKFPDFPECWPSSKPKISMSVTITDLHIAHAPNQKYLPYDSGIATDQFRQES